MITKERFLYILKDKLIYNKTIGFRCSHDDAINTCRVYLKFFEREISEIKNSSAKEWLEVLKPYMNPRYFDGDNRELFKYVENMITEYSNLRYIDIYVYSGVINTINHPLCGEAILSFITEDGVVDHHKPITDNDIYHNIYHDAKYTITSNFDYKKCSHITCHKNNIIRLFTYFDGLFFIENKPNNFIDFSIDNEYSHIHKYSDIRLSNYQRRLYFESVLKDKFNIILTLNIPRSNDEYDDYSKRPQCKKYNSPNFKSFPVVEDDDDLYNGLHFPNTVDLNRTFRDY